MCTLSIDDAEENFGSIMRQAAAIYSDKVKIHNWQERMLGEPRDNVDFFPPKGNLHRSSYRRLGPEEDIVTSETRSMLSQIKLKDEYKEVTCPRRNFIVAQSVAAFERENEEKKLTVAEIFLDPTVACQTDYRTTTSRDYWLSYSPRPLSSSPPPPEPWLMNRRTIGYDLEDLENRCGYHMFLDDNMDIYRRIAEIKRQRSKLYNPR
ncbi:uncharacterized protein LOC109863752 isoform X2 [Pseudomyrmex gracilis]|uniref:uncharacterized protein LOC109863752 isoform X2 n=1 Tax=Pseudomyrmex gracilis TaxID=219809 RepID=UPI000995312B|nr:uncharacterized protein LOC109863752 isoform X2 [Pseudomyrmex gracilis]